MKIYTLFIVLLSWQAYALECTEFRSQSALGQEIVQELNRNPINCFRHDVHMTFDDGPSPQITPQILNELRLRNVKASFFITTTNLQSSHPAHIRNRQIVRETMDQGHLIASHGHEHSAHDLRMNSSGQVLEAGFSDQRREREVRSSVELLNTATNGRFSRQRPLLFRFPYGRGAMPSQAELRELNRRGDVVLRGTTYAQQLREYRQQSPALQILAGEGFSHLGWNHDSQDSSHGSGAQSATVTKNYILSNLRNLCASQSRTQVALFHDIKAMNASSIPVILDVGKCLGLNFISPAQMVRNNESLISSGVYITRTETLAGPVRTLEDVMASLNSTSDPVLCPEEKEYRSCFSNHFQINYRHCRGRNSICFDGNWYPAGHAMVAECPANPEP